jgi:hypothetical protein
MKLLESGHSVEILGGANALCALAKQGEFMRLRIQVFRDVDDLPRQAPS